jgi:hypothetical protein
MQWVLPMMEPDQDNLVSQEWIELFGEADDEEPEFLWIFEWLLDAGLTVLLGYLIMQWGDQLTLMKVIGLLVIGKLLYRS